MDILDFGLDDIVIFELPTSEAVEAFRDGLRPRWDGWSDADEQMWLFTAHLGEEADLGSLLREAQDLLTALDLGAVRFFVDGRLYDLHPAPGFDTADLPAAA